MGRFSCVSPVRVLAFLGDSVVLALSVLALYDKIVFWGLEIIRWLSGFPLIRLRKGLRVGRVAGTKIYWVSLFFFLGLRYIPAKWFDFLIF